MINFDRRVETRAEDHIKTEKHRNHVQLSQRQTYMDSVPDKKNEFFAGLTKALVMSNIPLNKVENPNFKSFLEKWTKKELPSESTLRKTYLEDEGKKCIQDIILRPHGEDIHLIIDECTDVLGRYVLAVLVGVLDMHNESKPVLFEVVEIERTTSVAIRVVKLSNISVTVLFITLPKSNPPIVTRWNLWLECVFYCCQHFEMLSNFICNNLDKTEARAIIIRDRILMYLKIAKNVF